MKLKLLICSFLLLCGFEGSFGKKIKPIEINKSGIYATDNGTITVSVNNGVLTGVYEYYDKWDSKYQEYRDINVFYIYGTSSDGVNFIVNTGWPREGDFIKGTVTFSANYSKLTIVLADQPPGYAAIDFTERGNQNIFPLKKAINSSEVRIVKPTKAILYIRNDSAFIARKAYLIKDDIVCKIGDESVYIKISYTSPGTNKTSIYWIKESDLYPLNPNQWK